MSRKNEQADLIFAFGQLLGPFFKLTENPKSFDADERSRITARFYADYPRFLDLMGKFARGEPGHNYVPQQAIVQGRIEQFAAYLHQFLLPGDLARLESELASVRTTLTGAILSVPVPLDSTIHAATTPFSTYCLVKDLCSTSQKLIVWMDRYFDHTLFYRYFSDVPSGVEITLVTWPDTRCISSKDRQRYVEFGEVSRLFAQERKSSGYRLITNDSFHDRWLRCDDKLFALGGSIKDLGKDSTFTISRLDSTPENLGHFDGAIQNGTEVFGPNQPTHP